MDATERQLLDETVRDALTDAVVSGADAAAVDKVLGDLGWLEMLDAEPRDATAIVFTALGLTNGAASALDDVLATALGVAPRPDLAVVAPAFGSWAVPGRVESGTVRAEGLGTARVTTAGEVLVACAEGSEVSAVVVPSTAVVATPARGADADGGLHTVRVEHDGGAGHSIASQAWDDAVAAGRRAIGHQIAGASRTVLDLARTHAVEREQFGRSISKFQAVRHRLAEALVAIEALEATLEAAWDEPGSMTAALASAQAGRTARVVAAHCQQVLAGIGFTTEHPFHRFLKRTIALEGLFGSADEIVLDVGRQLLAARHVPTLIEL
jgi:alkylation response protein AidB-like acyl-CoA dehydrogenase